MKKLRENNVKNRKPVEIKWQNEKEKLREFSIKQWLNDENQYLCYGNGADGSFSRRQCKTGSRSRLRDEKKDNKFKKNQQ